MDLAIEYSEQDAQYVELAGYDTCEVCCAHLIECECEIGSPDWCE